MKRGNTASNEEEGYERRGRIERDVRRTDRDEKRAATPITITPPRRRTITKSVTMVTEAIQTETPKEQCMLKDLI